MVAYLHPADQHSAKITKSDKDFVKRLVFKDIKFPVKNRDIHKIEKNNYSGISAFGYENRVKYPIYVSKKILWIKTCWVIIDRRKRQAALWSYQRF